MSDLARYFVAARVRIRLHANPLGELLEEYTAALRGRGYLRSTLRNHLWALEHFGLWLRAQRLSARDVNRERVHSFLHEHLPACRCPAPAPCRLCHVRPALNHLLKLLRERGVGATKGFAPTPIDATLEPFRLYLRDTCGLAESTWRARVRYAREFLQGKFGHGPLRWEGLRPADVMSFVAGYAGRCRPGTTQAAAGALRSFLRYLLFRGWCGASLIAAVPRIPHWRLANLPRAMTDEQLRAFLAAFDRATATGRRDYAMALCQVELGLRVGEVADLRLDDIDWRAATIRIRPGKADRVRQLPLPARVGRALAEYLRRGRPTTLSRHVFIRHRGLRGHPVSADLIKGIMRLTYASVPGGERWTGTHLLRHTAATRMLGRGVSVKEIADVLGHRYLDTTAIYAKVDLPSLTAVALPWPEVKS
jgi:integrase